MSICPVCKKEFQQRQFLAGRKKNVLLSTKSIFCSRQCKSKLYYRRYYAEKFQWRNDQSCLCCQKTFVPISVNQKFCSRRCRGKDWKAHNLDKVYADQNDRARRKTTQKLSVLPSKICPICSKSFHALEDRRHAYKTFCSTRCNQIAQRKKRRARESYILKHPEEDPEFYWKVRTRKQITDANYKALKRGCKKCSGNHLHLEEWLAIKESYGFKCMICSTPETPQNPLTIDHILAISKGGENNSSNIQPLCRSCNSRKGNRR